MTPAKRMGVAALASLLIATTACGGDDSGDDAGDDGGGATDPTAASGTDGTGPDGPAGASSTGSEGASCEETVPGSELTFSVYASTGQLDPTLIAGGVVGGTEIAALYDTLFTYDYETNEVVPHLAEGITANDDFTSYTLKLREGITYSDGTPLDAQMVADNLDRFFADHATAPHASFLRMIEDKQVIDDTTLELTMAQPWAEFPSFLTEQPGMIVNTNAVGNDVNAFAGEPPDAAGVGPYVLERNAPGEEIVFTARDDYWGGPVCVETLRIVAISGGQQTYDAFKAGDLDVAFLRDPVAVAASQEDGVQGYFVPVDIGLMMILNHTDGHAANDPRLREAMWRAIEPDTLSDRAYQGSLNTSMSLIHPESAWATDDLATVEHDPERASQLVAEAKADGLSAELEIMSNTIPPAPEAALAWQGMLEAVGFEVTTTNRPVNEVVNEVQITGNYDAANYALSMEPAQLATRLFGALHSEGLNNRTFYESEEMDTAVTEAMAAPAEERADAVAKVNEVFTNDFVTPVMANNTEGIIWQDDVSGVVTNPTNVFLFHDAHIEE